MRNTSILRCSIGAEPTHKSIVLTWKIFEPKWKATKAIVVTPFKPPEEGGKLLCPSVLCPAQHRLVDTLSELMPTASPKTSVQVSK